MSERPEDDGTLQHIVQCSGGKGSYGAAKRVANRYGIERLTLLFADTQIEDQDLYAFLEDVAEDIGVPVTYIADGRNPFEVFKDVRYLGNTRSDPCSRILKRDLLRHYMEEHFDPNNTVLYLGIDWTEEHRFTSAQKRYHSMGWRVEAPLLWDPVIHPHQILKAMEHKGITVPRLYKMGFPHNNCGGGCVKAGQAEFVRLLENFPERFKWWMEQEEEVAEHIGSEVTILRDRSKKSIAQAHGWEASDLRNIHGLEGRLRAYEAPDGTELPLSVTLSLRELAHRHEVDPDSIDWTDSGGCGCAIDFEDDE